MATAVRSSCSGCRTGDGCRPGPTSIGPAVCSGCSWCWPSSSPSAPGPSHGGSPAGSNGSRRGWTRLGAGDLGARVDVEGSDEVAALAKSFNRAAARIESLVSVQRTMLASASHELRTPLARMRVAIELFTAAPRPELRERIERDIAELDSLIDELLLASRLETVHDVEAAEPVDLLALAAEEGARVGAAVTGEPVTVDGDRRLLRHLVRNLFENARRHGAGAAIDASVSRDEAGVVVRVRDRGPGIPESERERIFDPFHRAGAARETGTGVGLGLHLVKTIAERHGATVECRPNEPTGSCFVVRFPPGVRTP